MSDDFQAFGNRNIDLTTLLNALKDETLASINCMRLGIIEEVLEDNIAKCSITNKMYLSTNADGSSRVADYPPIYSVVWYMGSGDIGINYPLQLGSPCLLLFNDREIDSFLATGEISPLADMRMHSLSDSICIPLYRTTPTEQLSISADTITLNASTINLNAQQVNINGELIINGTPFLSHQHSNGNEGANTGGVV